MKRLRYLRITVLLVSLVLLGPIGLKAQTPQTPFKTMLANVPDNDASRYWLSYIDYAAIEEIWDLAEISYEEDIVGSPSDAGDLWIWTIGMTSYSGVYLDSIRTIMPGVPDMADQYPPMEMTLGFNMLDVDQSLLYGRPPQEGIMLTGDFDLESIRAAFGNRDFEQHEFDGLEVWCSSEGCDQGTRQDLANGINISNIFGGQLGRSEPLVITPRLLLNSPTLATVLDLIAVQNENHEALYDVPEYRFLAEAVQSQGRLIQITVLTPDPLPDYSGFSFNIWDFTDIALPQAAYDNALNSINEHFGVLPVYQMVGFAHVWNEGQHYGLVVLIYDNVEDAEIGAQEIHNRLLNATSLSSRSMTYANMLGGDFSEILPPVVYEGDNFAAAIVPIHVLQQDNADGRDQVTNSIYPYRSFVMMLSNRDLYFLGTEFILPE